MQVEYRLGENVTVNFVRVRRGILICVCVLILGQDVCVCFISLVLLAFLSLVNFWWIIQINNATPITVENNAIQKPIQK